MLCKIGDVEVWRVLEINAPYQAPDVLFPSAGARVAEMIEARAPGSICAKSGALILPIQGFLLKTASRTILVDACVGNHKSVPKYEPWNNRDSPRFMMALGAAGVSVHDIDVVLCTHLHTDHIGWNTRLEDGRWVPTFPNARYLIPAEDDALFSQAKGFPYQESVLPIIAAGQADKFATGHRLSDQVSLIATPGHTPGHVSVLIESNGQSAVITGDALHSTAQCWHPDWQFKFDTDPEMAVRSRRHLLNTCAEHAHRVLGTHFLLPSLGRVFTNGDVFAWTSEA